jgi:predicted MFS family arabinose efflux permease
VIGTFLTRGAQTMPNNAEAGGGLMVAMIQLAIALGSTVGGLLFDASGYRSTFLASAAVLLIAAFPTVLTSLGNVTGRVSQTPINEKCHDHQALRFRRQ